MKKYSTLITAANIFAIAASGSLAQSPLPELGFPQALGMQLKPNNFNTKTLDEVHALGFKVVRRGFYWNGVEKEKGVYNFDAYDAQMAHAKALGLTVVGCLFNSNSLYENHGKGPVLTDEGRKGFANFAAACAVRYKDQPVIWEIWNEPNVRTFWRKDGTHNSKEFAAEYSALVNAVVPVVLKANPDAFVVAGSVSNYWEPSYKWTEYCFQNGVLTSGIRGWSVHPYGVRNPEEHTIGHTRTRELLVKYGAPKMPMINTERGYAVAKTATNAGGWDADGRASDEGWSGGSQDKSLDYQAWHFVRQLLVDQLNGVHFSVWYEWGGNEGFGLWNPDGSPRPIVGACKKLVAELSGYRIVKRLDSDSARDYILLCENAKGDRKLVYWTSPQPGASPDETWNHDVALPLGAGGQKMALSLSGEPKYAPVAKNVSFGKIVTTTPKPVVAEVNPVTPQGATNLNLFDDAKNWKFSKNAAQGSFDVAKSDGIAIGVIEYDFTNAKSQNANFVSADAKINVATAAAVSLYARSDIAQQLTLRLGDSTGQTLQYKHRLKGTGTWEPVTIRLDKKLEAWGGAKTGFAVFPLKSMSLSIPKPSQNKGKVEFATVYVSGEGAKAEAVKPAPVAQSKPLAQPITLTVFDDASAWQFIKNTGDGNFATAKDSNGKNIGVMTYDFTQSTTSGTPYVLASTPVDIPGGTEIHIPVRTKIPQNLTFRITDATGQTLQSKGKSKGTGNWEIIKFPLNKKVEAWGGAATGFVNFPIKSLCFSVPRPSTLTGTVEYGEIVVK